MRGAGNISNMLDKWSEDKQKQEEDEKFAKGMRSALGPKWKELGYGSRAEFDNASAKEVLGTAHGMMSKATIEQHEQSKRTSAIQEKLGMAGLAEQEERQASRGRFNRLGEQMDDWTQGESTGGQISGQQMQRMALQAGLDPYDLQRVSQAGENFAQSAPGSMMTQFEEDPVSGMRFANRGRQMLPSGVNPQMMATPTSMGELQPGMSYMTPRGQVVRQPNLPDNEAKDRRVNVQALVDGEKALQGIEQEIAEYHRRLARSQTEKTVKPFAPSKLADLEKRRARITSVLESVDEPPTSAAAPAAAPAATSTRVVVEKDGQRYSLPAAQLKEAVGKGYKQIK